MSTLSSSSTLAQVWASYDDNASYMEDNSLAKARAFVTAVRILIRRTPSGATKGSNEVRISVNLLLDELTKAEDWIQARSFDDQIGPAVVKPDLRYQRRSIS